MSFDFPQFAQQHAADLEQQSSTPWLQGFRKEGVAEFANQPWPTRKTESWKYTSLFALTQSEYTAEATEAQLFVDELEAQMQLGDMDTARLVFVNGAFLEELSSGLDVNGVELVRFSEASEDQQAAIQAKMGSILTSDKHLFGALNNGLTHEGVYVKVAKNIVVEKPIQIVNVTTESSSQFVVNDRVLVELETGAQATLIEQFLGAGKGALVNSVSEFEIGDNAKLTHYRLQQEHEDVIHFGGVHVNLNRDSNINSFYLGLGGAIKRVDIVVNHNVGGSHCEMSGIYLPQGKQHIDYHSTIEHAAAHCTTNEVFRGIIADEAKAVFNGRIHIHKDAQKTLAELSNKNLLLSNKAEINTKPELEIYADDVRCAHGATVSQLNDEAMFYLLSRGISRQEAEVMMSFGFINELLNDLEHEEIQLALRPKLANRFGREELTRHLL